MQSQVLFPISLISFGNQALLVLSQKVMEFPIRVYVGGAGAKPTRAWSSSDPVRQPNPSAIQTQALQRPFRTLTPELSPISILHSLSTSRSPATCGLSFLLAWVKTINTLRTTDVFLLPLSPYPVCLVRVLGLSYIPIILQFYACISLPGWDQKICLNFASLLSRAGNHLLTCSASGTWFCLDRLDMLGLRM